MAATRGNVTTARRSFAENSTSATSPAVTSDPGLHFDRFVLLPDEGRLLHDGADVPLAPKPFETLTHLVRNAGRVVSKQELLEAVWPGTFISDDGLVQCVVDIRRALGDSARAPRFIQTIPKRGYRFLAPVCSPLGQSGVSPGSARGQSGVSPGSARGQAPVEPRADPGLTPGDSRGGRRSAVVLLAAFLVLLTVAAAVRWSRPASPPEPYAPESGLVVMLPMQMVEGLDDLGWLRTGVIDVVGAEITRWRGARLVPRHRVEEALAQAGLATTAVLPLEQGLAIARQLRAERLVTGSMQRVNERFVVQASIVDVGSGNRQRDVSVQGDRRADLPDALARFSHQLGEALGTAVPAARPSPAAVPMATKSLEAYRAYTEALEREGRGGRDESAEAEAKLRDAIRHDPTFAPAYVRLALVQQARRRWTYGNSDPAPAVRAARQMAADLPERERLLVNGLAYLLLDGNPARALDAWGALLRLYPAFSQESGVPTLVADTLMQQGRWAELILATEPHVDAPAVPASERALLHSLLAKAFRKQGEFDLAIAHATRASDLWPSREGPALLRIRTLLGRTLVDAGRVNEAIDVFRQIAQDERADVINVTDAGWGLYMAGQRSEATVLADRAIAADPTYGNAHHLRGWLQLTGGRPAQAAQSFAQAYDRTPVGFGVPEQGLVLGDVAALYYAGVAFNKAGDAPAASRMWRRMYDVCHGAAASRQAGQSSRATRWHVRYCVALAAARLGRGVPEPGRLEGDDATYFVLKARLDAARQRPEDALNALREAIRLRAGDLQHIADDPNFELLAGEPLFRQLVNAGRR